MQKSWIDAHADRILEETAAGNMTECPCSVVWTHRPVHINGFQRSNAALIGIRDVDFLESKILMNLIWTAYDD